MRRFPLFTSILAAALLLGAPAAADDRAQARARFHEGVTAYDRGDFETARASFLQALALKPHPDVMLNLGWSCLRAGRREEAQNWFQRYVDEAKDAPADKRRDAERGLAEAKRASHEDSSSTTTMSSARIVAAMTEDAPDDPRPEADAPSPPRARASSPLLLDGLVGVADNELGPALGVRGAMTLARRIRVGGALVYHFGHSFSRTVNRQSTNGSTAGVYLGPEVGYDVALGPVILRPYLGAGIAFLSSRVVGGVRATESDTAAVIWPGAVVEWLVPGSIVALGADLRLVTIPGGPAFSGFFTAGVRF